MRSFTELKKPSKVAASNHAAALVKKNITGYRVERSIEARSAISSGVG